MIEDEEDFKQEKMKNDKYIKEFEEALTNSKLVPKTIKKHVFNVDLYINEFLINYRHEKAEDATPYIDSFLGDWYIEKCLFATQDSLKGAAASLKKFYKFMSEKGYTSKDDYKFLCEIIKDEMDIWQTRLYKFDHYDKYEDWYF